MNAPNGLVFAAGNFPATATDEHTYSFGIFKILVNKKFWPMMDGTAGGHSLYYGYGAASHDFVSPLLHDDQTWLGLSAVHCMNPSDSTLYNASPGVSCSPTEPTATASYSEDLLNVADIPPLYPTSGDYNEVFTELINMQLGAYSNCVYSGSSTEPPPPYDMIDPMVIAGQPLHPSIHKSIGRMISGSPSSCSGSIANYPGGFNDYSSSLPAWSFFQVYVNVLIPYGPSTDVPSGGITLYNDPNDPFFGPQPLLISNPDVDSLPPTPIYLHGGALYAVPVKFLSAGSDQSGTITWNAGDTFGQLLLSGHELIPCGSGPQIENFITSALGLPGQQNPLPPVLWSFSTNTFPSPGITYSSTPGTNFGGGSIDEVYFTNTAYGTVYIRSSMHGSFVNPIMPPAPNVLATYTDSSSSFSCEVSLDDTNFFSASGSGSLQLNITNTGVSGKMTIYNTSVGSMSIVVNHNSAPDGPFLLRASLTKPSTGRHAVMSAGGGAYAASYLDMNYELSDDAGSTWYPANRSIRLSVAEPVCGVAGQGVYVKRSGASEIISWASTSYMLEGSTNLSNPFWVPISTNSPVTIAPTNGLHFFRTVCQE